MPIKKIAILALLCITLVAALDETTDGKKMTAEEEIKALEDRLSAGGDDGTKVHDEL